MSAPINDLSHEVCLIEPKEAAELLTKVRNAAPIDKRQVSTYARDMSAGLWKLNGDPIILDQAGEVMSGRLRLHAAVEAQAAFPTLIVRNVDSQHFDTIDALRRRTVSDIMSIRRERSGRALAAALTVLWRFSNDDYPTQSKKISSQALLAILEENPDIRFSLSTAKAASPRVPHGLGTALHYMFSRVDAAKADEFFGELTSEEATTPASQSLRRQLDESLRDGGRRLQPQVAGILIRTWEAYRTGRSLTLVRYSPNHDTFPKITGLGPKVRFDGVKQSTLEASLPATSPSKELRNLAVKVEIITPSRARDILERNDRNRSIASAVVEKYARDMKSGAWALNGQTIKIGESGRLLDGQHRCAAAVQANVSFPAIVVEGLDDDVFDTFDLGQRRSISAILKDRNESNTANLAAALRHVWLIENNLITLRNVAPTVSELLDTLERNPEIRESIKLITKVRDVTSSMALALHMFFHRIDAEKANEFMERLGDGVMLDATSPILRLREILLADKANQKRRLSETEKAAMMIKAWNFHIRDQPVKNLKWQNSGDRREPFPRIAEREEPVA
ncbi:MAG: hypothetical protein ACK4NU_01400 [Brevundimonas sp.]